MRKIMFILLTAVVLSSCGASQVQREARKTFNGGWTLSNISFPNSSDGLQVTLFEDATADCLRNSNWNFISNNNEGTYTLTSATCDTSTRHFIWSIDEVNAATGTYNLLLKPTNADHESTTGNQGFRINIVTLTDTNMVWEQTVNFEGEPFTIRMNFNKN